MTTGKLYIVGTPLGNLSDWSPRAAEVLQTADFIAAEDTRVTLKLLNKFQIKTPMVSYHEHNHKLRGEQIIGRLLQGESCALVTDAGMPAISDPGEDLVRLARSHGIEICSVPGPSALITALAASGLPSGRFCFEGFLSVNKNSRREHLLSLQKEERTLIFYEAPHKLIATLTDMKEIFGDRQIALCKELTKLHESVEVLSISAALENFETTPPKGEFVLVVHGAEPEVRQTLTLPQAVSLAKEYLAQGLSMPQASKQAALESGMKKSEIYRCLQELAE